MKPMYVIYIQNYLIGRIEEDRFQIKTQSLKQKSMSSMTHLQH